MGKLVAVEYVSLDGVMQGPGRPDEDTRGGFSRGGWAGPFMEKDPEAAQASMEGQSGTRAMLFGSRTYLDLVGHWLSTDEPNPFTEIIASTPKYVVSGTLTEPLPHPNSHLLGSDAVGGVRSLKEEIDGDVIILGSGELVRSLAAADLIDQYVLTTMPVVLGAGTRLFGDTAADLKVVRSVTSPTGIVVAVLEVQHPDGP